MRFATASPVQGRPRSEFLQACGCKDTRPLIRAVTDGRAEHKSHRPRSISALTKFHQREEEEVMSKGPTNIPEQNVERAIQTANFGMDWMRQFTEESLNQSRA